ncbi:alpha/beta fold hydrolase [Brevibacillus reuszeri]|uniref:alpha/beta fold hydrolase n=1 Tax=Brevibacillus reuszeri TaxID=54915 RepID=UPI00289E5FD7|nr:alpha/beta hydrolase [Brevibacillus reuszeri]
MYTIINDCQIYYEVHGKEDGDAIFFIHGAPGLGDCRADRKAFAPLETTHKLVFLDMRGSGRSEEKPPYTHEQWAADIDELRKQLHLDKIVIHGGSYGGYMALEYVTRYPQHVSEVMLRDTKPGSDRQDGATKRALEANLPGLTEDELVRMFAGEMHSNEELKSVFFALQPLYTVEYDPVSAKEKIDGIYYHYETHNFAFRVNQPTFNLRDKLPSIDVPVLVSVGRHDWITPVDASEEIASLVPRSELVIYENSGHSPHIEENEKYLNRVRQFLSK